MDIKYYFIIELNKNKLNLNFLIIGMDKSIIKTTTNIKNPIQNIPRQFKIVYIRGKAYELRRLFLPCIGLTSLLGIPALYNFVYLPIVIFMISFILFWNFPTMVTFTNTKPLYYEDLFIDTSKIHLLDVCPAKKIYFEKLFHWSLILTNSLFMAALSDYWLYKTFKENSYMEIIGITGGILKIFQLINHITGSILLQFTRELIHREHKHQQRLIEMQTFTSRNTIECPINSKIENKSKTLRQKSTKIKKNKKKYKHQIEARNYAQGHNKSKNSKNNKNNKSKNNISIEIVEMN